MRTPWFILIWVAVGISCAGPGYIEEPPPSHEHIRLLLSEPWQGHDGHIEETLADTLKRATYAIDCAFASLHSEKIISLLLEKAAHPNIRVRVAFDADVKMSDPGAQKLLESGLFSTEFDLAPTDKLLFGNKGDGRMFYTFCSVDERYNFLASQGIHPTLLTQIPVVAVLAHSDEYGLARELHKEMNMLSQGLFGFRKGKLDFQTKYSVLDQVMAIYWAPQENPMDVLGQELTQVQASVELYATSFQTTNNTQKRLLYDVPTILGGLENLKGKMVKKYFGMSAYWEKNNKVFTLPNPLQYQNPKVVVGTNIFLLDRHLEHPTTFIYIGSLRSRANSSDDGILLELRGRYIAEKIGRYLDKISETSQYVSHIGDESSPGAVKISEVMWMGSYDNNYVAYSSDEFIELYNTTDQIINVSGWRFACTTDGTSNNAAIVLPAGLVIGPKSYFVIATSETGAFAEAANLFEPKLKITNSSRECRLGNGRTSAASYGLANFGTVIDTIGNNTSPFDSASWNRGLNDTTNKVRRSMERIALHTSVGTSNGDWRTNLSTPSDNLQVSPEFRQQTFATPGAPNSGGDVGVPGSVVISEVHWMGSYTNTGTSDSDDEFIELYNTTGNPINISGWRFACTTNGTSANASIFLPPGTIILPHSYLVIATKTTGAFGAVAHIINDDLKITNSSRECRLGDASNSTAVYGLAGFGQSIDIIGNDTHGFDSANWNRGLNETTNRRSMERLNLAALGTSNSNWMTNLNIPANNNQVDINFRQRTFATPGLPATPPPPVLPGDVVINEIMWMGSYPNSGPGESDDEFIELHNKTTNSIHIGLWRISGSGVSTITIPVGETIPPNGYYVIARNNLHAFPSANYYRGTSLGISNSAFEIKLLTSLDFEVDKANNGGAPHAGVQNTDHPFARSMERKSGAVDGTLAASWQSCFAVGSGVAAGHNQRTIATPGAANSTPPVDPAVGDVVINEIMWMGSYNNSGTSFPDDEFIELWNKTAAPINISFWTITGTGVNDITLPPAQTIPANGYYVIARNNANAFPSADYYKGSTLGLSSTNLQLQLRTSLGTLIDTADDGVGTPLAGKDEQPDWRVRYSMERLATGIDGTSPSSWQGCYQASTTVHPSFRKRTIATPGMVNSSLPAAPNVADVVISEIMWMGSCQNNNSSANADEFVEIYNRTASELNLTGWKFACTTDGTSNNSAFTIPNGITIAPGGYLVIANQTSGAFPNADFATTQINLTNSSRECRLGDGRSSVTVYGISNFGTTIDTAGDNANGFDSTTWNRGLNSSSPTCLRKSMERIDLNASATSNTNWRTNGLLQSDTTFINTNYRNRTFASPGQSGAASYQNYGFNFENWYATNSPLGWHTMLDAGILETGFTQSTTEFLDGANSLRIQGTTTSNNEVLRNSVPVNRGSCTHLAVWLRGTGSAKSIVIEVTGGGSRYFNLTDSNTYTSLSSAVAINPSSSANYGTGFNSGGAWKVAYLNLSAAAAYDYLRFRLGTASTYDIYIDALQYLDGSKNPCTP